MLTVNARALGHRMHSSEGCVFFDARFAASRDVFLCAHL